MGKTHKGLRELKLVISGCAVDVLPLEVSDFLFPKLNKRGYFRQPLKNMFGFHGVFYKFVTGCPCALSLRPPSFHILLLSACLASIGFGGCTEDGPISPTLAGVSRSQGGLEPCQGCFLEIFHITWFCWPFLTQWSLNISFLR